MKEMLKRTWRQVTAFVLALVMVLCSGEGAIVAFADEIESDNSKKVINYVSLGDSMTNGYGLDGYRFEYGGELININGYLQTPTEAYPAQFAEYLSEKENAEVKLTQLAMSGMRAEEAYHLLTYDTADEFYADEYTKKAGYGRFNDSDIDKFEQGASGVANVAKKYKDSIAEADVISIGLGYNNFGTFLTSRLCYEITQMGFELGGTYYKSNLEELLEREADAELTATAMEMYDTLMETMKSQLTANGVADEKMLELCESMVEAAIYSYVGFVISYEGILNYISQVNPDAEVMIVGLANSLEGMVLSIPGVGTINMGEYFGYLTKSANLYMAGLPAAYDLISQVDSEKEFPLTVYYADPGSVELFITNIAEEDYQGAALLHERILEKTKEMVFPLVEIEHSNITLEDVEKVEKALNSDDINAFSNLNMNQDVLQQCAIYIGIEDAITKAAAMESIDFTAITALMDEQLLSSIFDSAIQKYQVAIEEKVKDLDENQKSIVQLKNTPTALAEAMDNDTIGSLLHMMARFLVGDGIGCHPNINGYDTITESMKKAYSSGHTATDYVTEEAIKALEEVTAYVKEYYDDAYAHAYDYAEKEGYITALTDKLDEISKTIAALDVDSLDLSDELKAELQSAIDNAVKTTKALNALITEADVLDDATLEAAMELLGKLGQNITDIREILTQAGKEAGEAAAAELEKLGEALWAEYEELKTIVTGNLKEAVAKGTEYLKEKMGDAYDAFVEAAKKAAEAAKEYSEEAAEYIYNWLKNCPEKLFALLNEYGDDVLDFLNEHKDAVFEVIGYIVSEYGDDIVDYVMDHADEILEALVDLYEQYGDKAWKLIKAYLDEIDILGKLEGSVDPEIMSEILAGLGELIEKYGPEILESGYEFAEELINEYIDQFVKYARPKVEKAIEDLTAQLEALEAELAAKKAELEKAIAELDEKVQAELTAAIEKIEAEIAKIEAAIKTLEEQLAKIDATIKNIVQAAKDLQDAVDNFISATEENRKEAAEAVKEALDSITAIVEKAEDVINAVSEKVEEVKATVEAIVNTIENIVDVAEKAIAGLDAETKAKLEAVFDEIEAIAGGLEDAISDFEAAIGTIKDNIETIGNAVEDIKTAINEILKNADADVQALIAEIKEAVSAITTAVENIADVITQIAETVEEVKEKVEAFVADVDAVVSETTAKIEAAINTLEEKIAEIKAAIKTLEEQLAEIDAQIKALEAEAKELKETIKELIDIVTGEITGTEEDIKAMLKDASEKLAEAMEKTIEIVKKVDTFIKEAVEIAESIVKTVNDIVKAVEEMEAAIDGILSDANQLVEDIKATAKDLETKANEAVKALETELNNAVEALEEGLAAIYNKATHGEYTVTDDSYYVALGDATVTGDRNYASLLAAALKLKDNQFNTLADGKLRVEDILYILDADAKADAYTKANVEDVKTLRAKYVAEIEKADLITISAESNAFVAAQLENACEMDWTRYVGTKGKAAVEKVLAEITAHITETLGVDMADKLTQLVEAYAYSYVGYIYNYPALLNAIHKINPDAKVVVVGRYNPFDELTVDGIPIGEYVGKLVELSNLSLTGYAMLTPNTTFVAIPGTETRMEAGEKGKASGDLAYIVQLINAFTKGNLNPSEDGHEYIKTQILNAISVTDATHKHVYGDYKFDEDNHWKECECGVRIDEEAHVYADDEDTTCDVCGYERKVEKDPVSDNPKPVDPTPDKPTQENPNAGKEEVSYVTPFSATLEKTSYTFDGNKKKPGVTVTDAKGNVVDAKYYTVTYKNNKNAGKATATITFHAPYASEKAIEKQFTIKKTTYKKISIKKVTYTGKKITKLTLVTNAGVKLAKSDYKILKSTFKKNKNIGTASVKIKFLNKNVKKKTVTMKFQIVPKGTSITKITRTKKTAAVTWKKQKKQTSGYQIQYSTSKNFTKKTTKSVKANLKKTTTVLKKLKASKKYYIRIRTYKKVGKKYYYSYWSKVRNTGNATSITKLTRGKKQMKVTWKKVSSVTRYQIQYSTSKNFTKKTTKQVNVKSSKSSVTIKKLKANKRYFVRIRTYKKTGNAKSYSAWSAVKNIRTK